MTRLNYDSLLIDNNIIEELNAAISSLNQALAAARQLNAPYNFSGSNLMNNQIPTQIESARSECNNIIYWLNQSQAAFSSTSERAVNEINSVNIANVPQHSSIIN